MNSEFTTMDTFHADDFQEIPNLVLTSAFADPEDDEDMEDPEPDPQKADSFDEFLVVENDENVAGVKNPT